MLDALVAAAADVEVGGDRLHGAALTAAVDLAAERFASVRRVAVVAAPTLQTIVTIAGAVTAGCTVVPLNPAAGDQERTHVLRDSRPDVVVDGDLVTTTEPDELIDDAIDDDGRDDAALIVYTS